MLLTLFAVTIASCTNDGRSVGLTFRNASDRSIPLQIPGVMNPNLNAWNNSGFCCERTDRCGELRWCWVRSSAVSIVRHVTLMLRRDGLSRTAMLTGGAHIGRMLGAPRFRSAYARRGAGGARRLQTPTAQASPLFRLVSDQLHCLQTVYDERFSCEYEFATE